MVHTLLPSKLHKKIDQRGFSIEVVLIVLVVLGVAAIGVKFFYLSHADTLDPAAYTVQIEKTANGCWLAGRTWDTAASNCTHKCRVPTTTYKDDSDQEPGYCSGAVAKVLSANECVNTLHRIYLNNLGCARRLSTDPSDNARQCTGWSGWAAHKTVYSRYVTTATDDVCVAPVATATPAPPAATPVTTSTFKNPLIDSIGGAPSIIRDNDGTYYIYATHDCNGNVFCTWKSTNLVNWKKTTANTFTSRPSILTAGNITWAPDVTKVGSVYVMTYSGCDDAKLAVGYRRCIGYATSSSAAGPFNPQGVLVSRGRDASTDISNGPGAIDSHIVVDGSNVYLLYGSGGIEMVPLTPGAGNTFTAVKSKAKQLVGGDYPVAEGSYLYKHGSYWYLYYSYGLYSADANGTAREYNTRVVRSTTVMGDYSGPVSAAPTNNNQQDNDPGKYASVLTGTASFRGPGCPGVFTDDSGTDWIIYHAYPKGENFRATMLDKITYTNGWPVVNSGHPSTGVIASPAVKK